MTMFNSYDIMIKMRDLTEITKQELDNIKVITFDIDGVIAPVGTEIIEEDGGTKLSMESKPLSEKFLEKSIDPNRSLSLFSKMQEIFVLYQVTRF